MINAKAKPWPGSAVYQRPCSAITISEASSRSRCSSNISRVVARLSLHRITDDKVITGNMRKSAKVRGVVEAAVAGRKPFVAAGGDNECVTDQNGLRHGLPEFDGNRAAFIMAFYLNAETRVGAARKYELARPEPAIVEIIKPTRRKR